MRKEKPGFGAVVENCGFFFSPPPLSTPHKTNLHPRSAAAAMSSGMTPSSSKAATDMFEMKRQEQNKKNKPPAEKPV